METSSFPFIADPERKPTRGSLRRLTSNPTMSHPQRGDVNRYAEINLLGPGGAPAVVWSVGIKRGDLRRLIAETIELRGVFLQEWKRIHG